MFLQKVFNQLYMPFTYLRTFFLLLTGMYTECFQNVQNILLLYNGQFTSKSGSIFDKLFISLLSYGQFFDFWQVCIMIVFKIFKTTFTYTDWEKPNGNPKTEMFSKHSKYPSTFLRTFFNQKRTISFESFQNVQNIPSLIYGHFLIKN